MKLSPEIFLPATKARVELSFLLKNSKESHLALNQNHGTGLLCLCKGRNAAAKLAIRSLHGGKQFVLARYPDSAHLHDPQCPFYAPPNWATGLDGYEHNVVVRHEDHSVVKLGLQLIRYLEPENAVTQASEGLEVRGQRSKATIGGLLAELYDRAGFNLWRPGMAGKRHWGLVRYHLTKETQHIRLSTKKGSLDKLLWVVGGRASDRDAFFASYKPTGNKVPRCMVVGEVEAFVEDRGDTHFRFVNDSKRYYVNDAALHKTPNQTITRIKKAIADDAQWFIMICGIELSAKLHPRIVRLAGFASNSHYIPVESRYELAVADQLIGQGRSFHKPMRYDASEKVYPDFILSDCANDQEVIMEVYGGDGFEGYTRRKQEKRAFYRENNIPVWEWDLSTNPAMPTFPVKKT